VGALEGAVRLSMTMVATASEWVANLNQIVGTDEMSLVESNEMSFVGSQTESNADMVVMYVVRFDGAQYTLKLGMAEHVVSPTVVVSQNESNADMVVMYVVRFDVTQYTLELGVVEHMVRSTVG
jgi:hypothetical protein